MRKTSYRTSNLLICIFELLVGVLLLINPVGFTSGIIVVFGVILAVIGAASLVKYFRTSAETAAQEHSLAKGLLFLLFGLFCAFRSEWFIVTFPLLTVLYGILALLCGTCKVQWAVDMLRAHQKYWFIEAIGAALSILHAVLILANPFASTAVLWLFIGISMIVESLVDVAALVMERKQN